MWKEESQSVGGNLIKSEGKLKTMFKNDPEKIHLVTENGAKMYTITTEE